MSDMFAQYYDLVRAAHIIFVIYWMAGLLYLPRLFVYHHQAQQGGELETTLIQQEKRLLKIIMNPAMIVTFLSGLWLVTMRWDSSTVQIWLYAKLIFVFALMGFHGALSKDRKIFEAGGRPRTEKAYRIMNEVPAIAAIIIVILVVIEPFTL